VDLAIGTYPRHKTAVELLDKNLAANKANPFDILEDLRIKAIVRARMPGQENTSDAAKILEELDQTRPLSAEDRFLLVQLYSRLGEQEKGEKTMARLLRENPSNMRFLTAQMDELLQKKDPSWAQKAQSIVSSAKNFAPGDPAVLAMNVRLLFTQSKSEPSKHDEARDMLASWVKTNKEGDPSVMAAAAGLCEQLSQFRLAEEYYRDYANDPKAAEGTLLLARFLGRQKDSLSEAIELCKKAWANSPPDEVAGALMTILRSGTPSEIDLQRAKDQLQAAIQKENRPALVLSLAGIAELRGKHEEAEQIYLQVLAGNRNNPVALNNLAWVLALQNRDPNQVLEALKLVNSAMALLGPIPELLDTRGVIFHKLGEVEKAIKDLQEVTQRPEAQQRLKATAWFHLALIYRQTMDEESARRAFEESKKLGLTPDQLTPLERATHKELAKELGIK
jgi:tetratricopeptide (TPR) repeat protein